VGAIVGTGIFVIPAIAVSIAGLSSIWVWIQLGALTIFMAFCFAELGSIYPDAGGPYKFVKEAFGPYAGFLSGWNAWLISWVTIASLCVAISYYVSYFVPLTRMQEILLAIFVLIGVTFLNFKGLKWGVKAQYLLTTLSVTILVGYVILGIRFVNVHHFLPVGVINLKALLAASVIVVEPFIGWETITYFAEDAKLPRKNIPIAIIYASMLVTILYSLVIFVTLGVLHYTRLEYTNYPLAIAAEMFIGTRGAAILAIGGIAVLLGCLNSWVISTARLPFSIARDGLFPKFLTKIHKQYKTPYLALGFQFVFSTLAILMGTFEEIIFVLVALAMILYLSIFISIPIHRKRHEKILFKLPFGGTVPLIASLLALTILYLVEWIYLAIAIFILFAGTPIYLVMKRNV
jgi:amino acid transporter